MSRNINLLFGSAIGVFLGVSSAFGNPSDPTVVNGSASFEESGPVLNVTNTSGTIIDWNSFSIDQDEVTRFIQESSSSSVLNRVTGGNLSEILGDLQSNGRVFLINPNGLIVGDGAVIDTAGFIGSTLDISNAAFTSGELSFNGNSGTIENRGLIHVSNEGDIALIATSVENSGILRSENGDILLAAGRSVSVSFDGLQNLSFEVHAPANEVVNLGEIVANGGSASLLGGQGSNTGGIELVESDDGRIFLHAADLAAVGGNLSSNGGDIHIEARQVELRQAVLDAGAYGPVGTSSGDISLLGDNVGLFSGTRVDSTGSNGGGTILIGGEQQGRGQTRRSDFVFVDHDASVSANGGVNGDGGTIILFAEDSARVHGQVSARGGLDSGDGGFIETSGLLGLQVSSAPDAGANNGQDGTWLIDPFNIRITSPDDMPFEFVDLDDDDPAISAFSAIGEFAFITNETIVTALDSSEVIIDTGTTGSQGGDITIEAAIVTSTGNDLTFNAARDIFVNAVIDLGEADGATLQFNADQNGDGDGATILGEDDVDFGNTSSPDAFLAASNIEFINGLMLPDSAEPFNLNAEMISVTGGATVSGNSLNLMANEATIDFLTANPVDTVGTNIRGSGDTFVEIGSLTVNAPSDPINQNQIVTLSDAEFVLSGASSIELFPVNEVLDKTLVPDGNLGAINNFFGTAGGSIPGVVFLGSVTNEGVLDIFGDGAIGFGVDEGGNLINDAMLNNNGEINFGGSAVIGIGNAFENGGVVNIVPVSEFGVSGGQSTDIVSISGFFDNFGLLNISAQLDANSLFSSGEIHFESGGILNLFDPGLDSTPFPVNLEIGQSSIISGNGTINLSGELVINW